MRVRLGPGVEPERAIAEINELAGSKATAVQAGSVHPANRREDYGQWSTNVEARLASVLRREDAQAFFDNPRHRDICSMPVDSHLTALINAEVDAKTRDLEDAVAYLRTLMARMRAAPGLPIVVDSNVLLQCQRLDNVNWRKAVDEEARVMVPLRVIEEIDAKKYGDTPRLRGIARELLPWIDSLFSSAELGPVRLRDDATIELVLAELPRYRPTDADEEVLDLAHDVALFSGRVRVMTADTGMRLRARSERLDVLFIPAEWRRPVGET